MNLLLLKISAFDTELITWYRTQNACSNYSIMNSSSNVGENPKIHITIDSCSLGTRKIFCITYVIES